MPQAENNEVLAELSQVKHGQMQLNGLRGSERTIRPSPLQAKRAVFICCLLKCFQNLSTMEISLRCDLDPLKANSKMDATKHWGQT